MEPAEYEVMHRQEMVHWWFRGRRALLRRLLARHVSAGREPPRLLDFGCGTGGNAVGYADVGPVVGVEPDAEALRFAGTRPGATRHRLDYCRAVGTARPLRSGAFDAVLASDVLEHIADDAAAVREIARVLRPGGAFIFSVPAHPWLWSAHDVALWHQRRYRRGELVRLLEGAGLRVRWLSYWNAVLFPVVAARRVLAPRLGDKSAGSDTVLPSPPVNSVLAGILGAEARALDWIRFPFGVSLVGVATSSAH
jgi:SAM-dependent methyltransferase